MTTDRQRRTSDSVKFAWLARWGPVAATVASALIGGTVAYAQSRADVKALEVRLTNSEKAVAGHTETLKTISDNVTKIVCILEPADCHPRLP